MILLRIDKKISGYFEDKVDQIDIVLEKLFWAKFEFSLFSSTYLKT